jgi:hypothetical protein
MQYIDCLSELRYDLRCLELDDDGRQWGLRMPPGLKLVLASALLS